MTAILGDFPKLEIDGLDRISGVHNLTQLGRIVKERNELVPAVTPHIDSTGILRAELLVERGETELRGLERRRSVDFLHRLDDLLTITVRYEPHRITDDVHHTRLHHGVGENRTNRVGQARQAVAARDKDILDTAIAQVRQDFLPELRPSVSCIQQPRACLRPSTSTPMAR